MPTSAPSSQSNTAPDIAADAAPAPSPDTTVPEIPEELWMLWEPEDELWMPTGDLCSVARGYIVFFSRDEAEREAATLRKFKLYGSECVAVRVK